MLDKIAKDIGVSTEALIKVVDAISSQCPHHFGISRDYEKFNSYSTCVAECADCWNKVIDKLSTI